MLVEGAGADLVAVDAGLLEEGAEVAADEEALGPIFSCSRSCAIWAWRTLSSRSTGQGSMN